jgi:hypothetical protein
MTSPSHETFATSTMVFILTMAWIIHERREDKLQDHFLLGGGCFGAVLGIMTGYDVQGIMLSMMPAATLAGVILSAVLHEFFGKTKLLKDSDIGKVGQVILSNDSDSVHCQYQDEDHHPTKGHEEGMVAL